MIAILLPFLSDNRSEETVLRSIFACQLLGWAQRLRSMINRVANNTTLLKVSKSVCTFNSGFFVNAVYFAECTAGTSGNIADTASHTKQYYELNAENADWKKYKR